MTPTAGFQPYKGPVAAQRVRLNRPLKQLTFGLKEVFQRGIQPDLRIKGSDWKARIPLGSGSFATVYSIPALGLAAKVNQPNEYNIAKHEESLLNRWRDVPYVIKFYGSFYVSINKKALVMDQICHTLEDFFKIQELTSGQSFLLVLQLLKMAKVLFSKKAVHADLSFKNLSFDNYRLTVFDLGYAHFIPETLSKVSAHGLQTPLVRAPEICVGRRYDCSIDWWSIGAIFFRAYTGHHLIDLDRLDRLDDLIWQIQDRIGPFPDHWEVKCCERRYARLLTLEQQLELTGRQKEIPAEIHRLVVQLMKGLLSYENRLTPEEGLDLLDAIKGQIDSAPAKRLKTA